jgi:hypothetical protein
VAEGGFMVVLWWFCGHLQSGLLADSVFRMVGILLFSIHYTTRYLHLVTHHHSNLFVSGTLLFAAHTHLISFIITLHSAAW